MAGFLSLCAAPSFSAGPFTDVARVSDFVTAHRVPGVSGSITRADAGGLGASVFNLAGFFPVRSVFLMQLETCYATLETADGIAEGFGDVLLSMRARAWAGRRKALSITSCVRFGTGASAYFPYATASTDVEAGLAFCDSLGFGDDASAPPPKRYLSYWIAGSGTYVLRLNDLLEEQELHGNNLSGGGGVVLGLSRAVSVEAGGMGLVFDSGAVREIYFSRLTVYFSPGADVHLAVQGERGDWRERAVDASAQIGLTVRY